MDPRAIRTMMRSPRAMMDFQATGKLPQVDVRSSPLITLIESINPRARVLITAVKLVPELGYKGGIRFQNLAQALNWLKPTASTTDYLHESCQLKTFTQQLTIDDLKPFADIPEHVEREWNRQNGRR